jgi:hypothetical protein
MITATTRADINVRAATYCIERLRELWPAWDDNPRWVKAKLLQRTDPDTLTEERNTTTIALHESIVDALDGQSVDIAVSHLAIGDSDTQPASGDRQLNSEQGRFPVTDQSDNGDSLFTFTLLDTSEANGVTIQEIGLTTGSNSEDILNHSLISDIPKDDERTGSIEVTLSFAPA